MRSEGETVCPLRKAQLSDKAASLIISLDAFRALREKGKISRTLRLPAKMMIPKLLARLDRSQRVSTSTFFGEILTVVLPEAVSTELYRYRFFERDVCAFLILTLRPGQTFVDVGAHFGFFSVLARHLVGDEGRIVAFEPTPSTFQVLSHNLQKWGNATAINKAAWNEQSALEIQDFGLTLSAYNSIFSARQDERTRGKSAVRITKVEAIDLDTELARLNVVPDVIKIDAESSELQVLRGAMRILTNCRPAISMEVGDFDVPGASLSRDLILNVMSYDYEPIELIGTNFHKHEVRERYGYENIFFVPKERVPEFVR